MIQLYARTNGFNNVLGVALYILYLTIKERQDRCILGTSALICHNYHWSIVICYIYRRVACIAAEKAKKTNGRTMACFPSSLLPFYVLWILYVKNCNIKYLSIIYRHHLHLDHVVVLVVVVPLLVLALFLLVRLLLCSTSPFWSLFYIVYVNSYRQCLLSFLLYLPCVFMYFCLC